MNKYKLLRYNNLSFFFIILLSKTSSAAHYQYEACGPINCGSGPNISFPFYIPGRQESYCGYPGFALNCSLHGFPILQLNENEYFVEQIFNQNRSFHVFDAAVLGSDSTTCFPGLENITLPLARFNYVSTTGRVYLFSGCRRPWPERLVRYNVSNCDNWDLAIYEGDENLGDAIEICERDVVAPVDEGRNGISNVWEVLRRGFVLNWTASDCNVCEDSGGHCGFNASNYHFRCFCPDRPHSRSCKPDQKLMMC
ncbi:hypothetical protein CASFOL_024338 [Castilleja foliolosa]|uniref:non-specific serine/threonine protein kinase n=1 Tax=Castilleja foliolosa TaxID=1961234 RepID=A0ABD3CQC9_9LAMI